MRDPQKWPVIPIAYS